MSYLQVYLSEAARLCEIVTSKSSEMNVLLPPKTEGGDYVCFQLCLLSNSVNDILIILFLGGVSNPGTVQDYVRGEQAHNHHL